MLWAISGNVRQIRIHAASPSSPAMPTPADTSLAGGLSGTFADIAEGAGKTSEAGFTLIALVS
jgi:hypothetical protein